MKKEPSISLVFPAYNAQNLCNSVNRYIDGVGRYKKSEFILVVDGVTGEEERKIRNELGNIKVVINRKRLGKGSAIREGFKLAKNSIVGFVDVDESVPIKELIKVIESAGKTGCSIGTRRYGQYGSKIRIFLSKAFNFYVRLILGLKLKDTQCGVKFFSKENMDLIKDRLKINGFAIDAEILYLLKKNRIEVKEVEIKWKEAKKSTVSLFSIIGMFFDILRIRFGF